MNPKAIFVPCANHSLNLVIVDAVASSRQALTFFGVLTRLYTIFSSSTARWTILKECVPISVKAQSDTRWESRINCIKPLRFYLNKVVEALQKLEDYAEEKKDGATASGAQITAWPFVLTLVIYGMTFYSRLIKPVNLFNRHRQVSTFWLMKSRPLAHFYRVTRKPDLRILF